MRNWKVAIAVLLMWFGVVLQAHSLGLGDIEVNSALNQPLEAKIELLAAKQDEISQLRISLADQIAFTTSGVDRVPMLSQLNFAIEQTGGGKVYIVVTTKNSVKEPFLDFIIEANWASGRLLREYTVLLDPPVFAGSKAAPAQQAPSAERRTKSVSELIEGVAEESAPKRPTKSVAELLAGESDFSAPRRTKNVSDLMDDAGAAGRDYGPTKRSDTLWSIAETVRPTPSNSIEQVMMALYQNNPEAFFDENINNMKAGIVLRTPDQQQIEQLAKSDAAKLAREHYSRWLAARRVAAATKIDSVGSKTGLAVRADGAEVNGSVGGESSRSPALRLESPADNSGGLGGAGNEEIAAALAMKESENQELQSQIAALEDQLGTMERMLTLKEDSLVQMQRQLGTSGQQVEIPSQDVAPLPEQTVNEQPTQTETPTARKPIPPAESPDDAGSWTDMLMDTTVLGILVGLVLLVGAIVWMVIRRRQQDADDFDVNYPSMDDEIKIPNAESLNFSKTAAGAGVGAGAFMPNLGDTHSEMDQTDDLAEMGLETMEADEADIDPIAEADVYLAYRRFQQAEEIIKEALEHEPERQDLQAKLLEIYYSAGNRQGFEARAEALYALLGGEENETWQRVSEMGRELCPDHPLFNPGGHEVAADGLAHSDLSEVDAPVPYDQTESDVSPMDDNIFAGQDYDEQSFSAHQPEFDEPAALDSSFDAELESTSLFDEPGDSGSINFEAGLGQNRSAKDKASGALVENPGGGLDFDFNASANELNFSAPHAENTADDASGDEQDFLKIFDNADLDNFEFGEIDHAESNDKTAAKSARNGEVEEIFTGLEQAEFGDDTDELFSGTDMIGTKLDLARAYIDMDDREGARGILQEVLEEGDDGQKQQAKSLMQQIG